VIFSRGNRMNLLWVAFEMVFWMGFVYPVTVIFMD
jgi:hypothetical protein